MDINESNDSIRIGRTTYKVTPGPDAAVPVRLVGPRGGLTALFTAPNLKGTNCGHLATGYNPRTAKHETNALYTVGGRVRHYSLSTSTSESLGLHVALIARSCVECYLVKHSLTEAQFDVAATLWADAYGTVQNLSNIIDAARRLA